MKNLLFIDFDGLPQFGNILIELVIVIVLGFIAVRIIIALLRRSLKKSSVDPVLYTFILNSVRVALFIILGTMCLSIMQVSMSSIVAVIGAAGAAVALALRDSLANIAGGVMIIVTKPFNQNDLIDIGEIRGRVQKIDLFITTLNTLDNKTVTVPNGIINTSVLINHSREDDRRVDCKFGIGYESDITFAKSVILDVIHGDSRIYKLPKPTVAVAEHGESAILLDVMVWCSNDDYWNVKYALEENVKLAFDEKGIDIPYSQVDVHIHNHNVE
ncbi:MAG: mechanosensitive ion channel [Bacillota bacterium]|nr:mechanosensitive ion channel [Bacillota bacterium]